MAVESLLLALSFWDCGGTNPGCREKNYCIFFDNPVVCAAMSRILALSLLLLGACSIDASVRGKGNTGVTPGPAPSPDAGPEVPPDSPPDADVPAPDPTSGPGTLVSVGTDTPPNIADDLFDPEEWADADFTGFEIEDAALREKQGNYSFSASVEFASMHTDTDLYLLLKISDDLLLDDDGLVLMLDAKGDATGPYGMDDHLFWVGPTGLQFLSPMADNFIFSGTIHPTDDGQVIEMLIDKSSLGAASVSNGMGFNIAINDADEGGVGYGVWHIEPGERCTNCCQGQSAPSCDTTMLGDLILQ
jgi:hypothetical protein